MSESGRLRRRVYTHNQLLGVAKSLTQPAGEDSEFSRAMASILFCALALEALLNHIGASLLPTWEEHFKRRLTPEGKLALISSRVSFTVDFGRRPFQAFRVLFEFRNRLAHGVTEDLPYETARHWLEYGVHRWPAAKWEVLCTPEKAASLVADTGQIIDTLFRVSGVEVIPEFLISEHVGSAQQAAPADPPGG
jgi:hypothetical protein